MDRQIWIIIIGMTLVTFIPRVIPFFVIKGENLPPLVKEWLRLLPVVIFASMVAPPLLTSDAGFNPASHITEILVVLAGAVTAFFTRKIPLSLGAAVAVLLFVNFF